VSAPAALAAQPSHTLRRVRLVDRESGALLDEALCAVMRAPRSYTGEDVVELSCHGSPALLAAVVERVCREGARLAAPGEFTRRAFVNGRMDLARAEAVALMISARTERAVALAARALDGALGARLRVVREGLLDVIAGLEVALDFPDDGVGLDVAAARARIEAVARDVATLVAAGRRGRVVHEGVTIALVGRPNAGKSSLLNALLGRERAIVSATPGTTRDVVEGTIELAGVPVRLLDTAGLGAPGDSVEAEGMKRTRAAMDESDVVVLVVDGSAAAADMGSELAGARVVTVWSKADLPRHHATELPPDALAVSAVSGAGLRALVARLAETVTELVGAADEESQIAATLRQAEALTKTAGSLNSAAAALGAFPLEVALVDLREALATTTSLLGLELGDAVLDRVFATFCVGK
jgi:tRNA modification GTPase